MLMGFIGGGAVGFIGGGCVPFEEAAGMEVRSCGWETGAAFNPDAALSGGAGGSAVGTASGAIVGGIMESMKEK